MTITPNPTLPSASGRSAVADPAPPVDDDLLDTLLGQAVGDLGSLLTGTLVVLGDRLGLYRELASSGSLTAAELAGRTGTVERNVREWLSAQAAAGYVTHDGRVGGAERFSLSAEQAEVLTNEDSPAFVVGGFQAMAAATRSVDQLTDAFRTGHGLDWSQHEHDLFHGTHRFFRPGYRANLVEHWIPALQDVERRLVDGCRVADVGCGLGASTILLAEAFPRSTFVGFDMHAPSISEARACASDALVADRVTFEVAGAGSYPGGDFDLVCFFDCLHDMGDPVGALSHVVSTLTDDGTVLLVEPFAGDDLADNLNPVGRVFYAASTLICTPASQAQEVGLALGAQAGEARLREVAAQAGLTQFRRVAETPFSLVLEARR